MKTGLKKWRMKLSTGCTWLKTGNRGSFLNVIRIVYSRRTINLTASADTGMRRITKFRSMTDRIYDGGPIRL